MEPGTIIILSACAVVLAVLLGMWVRLYRRQRRARPEFGKETVHELTLKKSPPSRSSPVQ